VRHRRLSCARGQFSVKLVFLPREFGGRVMDDGALKAVLSARSSFTSRKSSPQSPRAKACSRRIKARPSTHRALRKSNPSARAAWPRCRARNAQRSARAGTGLSRRRPSTLSHLEKTVVLTIFMAPAAGHKALCRIRSLEKANMMLSRPISRAAGLFQPPGPFLSSRRAGALYLACRGSRHQRRPVVGSAYAFLPERSHGDEIATAH